MTWVLTEQEKAAVLMLPGSKRYDYFVKKVADENTIWSLWQSGWALAEDSDQRQVVPIWPHAQFAEICARGEWANYTALPIEMDAWVQRWLPGIEKDSRLLAIFPTTADRGIVVAPSKLASDLEQELSRYK